VKVACFTSATASYLPNARILAASVHEHEPDWDVHLLLNDRSPSEIRWEEEPFDRVTFAEWLDLGRSWHRWIFEHSVVESCTGLKGVMSQFLLGRLGYDAVVYLDPDTRLFSPLSEVTELLETGAADVMLTPHLTDPESEEAAVQSHEIAALKHGTFNLGFFAIRDSANGHRYLDWWAKRLLDHCDIDFEAGLFTDQKWCNIVPYMFEGVHVITSRTYNVATWNATNREITRNDDGDWLVNGERLRFYHFSGFGNDFAWADRELAMFSGDADRLRELWAMYRDLYEANRLAQPADWYWGSTDSGLRIDRKMRLASRVESLVNPYDDE
jgi:hypothetical protein